MEPPATVSRPDPRRSFLKRPASFVRGESSRSGTSNTDTQEIRLSDVNLKLQQLGVPIPPGKKEENRGEIFASLMNLAEKAGIYRGNIQIQDGAQTAEKEHEEYDAENSEHEYEAANSDATTTDGESDDDDGSEADIVEEEKSGRGPTELKGFWKKYDPNTKIKVEFNHLGQPCDLKTSSLASFIGSLVKGKEISVEYTHWRKVPKHLKEKLWNTVKAFFDIEEKHKEWVLSSAGKKWKEFKCWLKRKYYKPELSTRRNILNGCGKRIPQEQWAWLVKHWKSKRAKVLSAMNSAARLDQSNATHTAGSRSFAVVLEQEEILQGRMVGRAELYRLTHTNKKGEAVDDFAEAKIKKINEELEKNPALLGEKHSENDLYSTLFPKAKKSYRHGLGRVVGGRASEELAIALDALEKSQQDNREMRSMFDIMMEKTAQLEERVSQFEATQKVQSTGESKLDEQAGERCQAAKNKEVTKTQQPKPIREVVDAEIKDKNANKRQRVKDITGVTCSGSKEKDGSRSQKQVTYADEANTTQDVSKTLSYRSLQAKEQDISKVHQIKVEKAEENKKLNNANKKKASKKLKPGMDVALTSPRSEDLVALGTLQEVNSGDYVQVMINMVLKSTTFLPQAEGRLTLVGHAQAQSVSWPKNRVSTEEVDPYHAEILHSIDKNLRLHRRSDGKEPLTLEEQAGIRKIEKPKKRKKSLNDLSSQAVESHAET